MALDRFICTFDFSWSNPLSSCFSSPDDILFSIRRRRAGAREGKVQAHLGRSGQHLLRTHFVLNRRFIICFFSISLFLYLSLSLSALLFRLFSYFRPLSAVSLVSGCLHLRVSSAKCIPSIKRQQRSILSLLTEPTRICCSGPKLLCRPFWAIQNVVRTTVNKSPALDDRLVKWSKLFGEQSRCLTIILPYRLLSLKTIRI